MALLQIGAGYAWITDNTQTPAQRIALGLLKSGKVGFKYKQEFEAGAKQIAVYAANLETEIAGELNFKAIDIATMLAIGLAQLSGGTVASRIVAPDVAFTVAASVPVTGSTDVLSVRDLATGNFFKKVASAPAVGQYAYTAPNVTFNATDVGKSVAITSLRNAATETNAVNLVNAIHQQTPYFSVEGLGLFDGKQVYYRFPRCVATDLPDAFSAGDKFKENKIAFKVMADPITDSVGQISFTEVLS